MPKKKSTHNPSLTEKSASDEQRVELLALTALFQKISEQRRKYFSSTLSISGLMLSQYISFPSFVYQECDVLLSLLRKTLTQSADNDTPSLQYLASLGLETVVF